jgi:hypothetical protein
MDIELNGVSLFFYNNIQPEDEEYGPKHGARVKIW